MKSQTSLQEKIGSLIRLCLIVSLLIIGIRPISAQNNIVLRSETDGSVYRWEVDGFQITDSDYVFRGSIPEWKVVGTPGLLKAGQPGILLPSQVDGAVYYWDIDGFNILSGKILFNRAIPEWKIVGDYLK